MKHLIWTCSLLLLLPASVSAQEAPQTALAQKDAAAEAGTPEGPYREELELLSRHPSAAVRHSYALLTQGQCSMADVWQTEERWIDMKLRYGCSAVERESLLTRLLVNLRHQQMLVLVSSHYDPAALGDPAPALNDKIEAAEHALRELRSLENAKPAAEKSGGNRRGSVGSK